MSRIFKPLSDSYKKLVHVEGDNSYPWLDRVISYGLPTAGAVLWSVLGTHGQIEKSDKTNTPYTPLAKSYSSWGLPAGLAFYGISQVGLTYLKPLVEVKESDSALTKTGKEVGDLGIKLLDALNNTVPYTIAYNMLPSTYETNKVFAFKVMPTIISSVESDIKASVNSNKYEGEFAGEVYSSILAGLASKNLSSYCSGKAETVDGTGKKSSNFGSVFVDSIVDGLTFSVLQKALVGKNYDKGEFKSGFYRSALQNMMFETGFFTDEKLLPGDISNKLKDSVFENIAFFTAVECATLVLDKTCELMESAPEITSDLQDEALINVNIKGSL